MAKYTEDLKRVWWDLGGEPSTAILQLNGCLKYSGGRGGWGVRGPATKSAGPRPGKSPSRFRPESRCSPRTWAMAHAQNADTSGTLLVTSAQEAAVPGSSTAAARTRPCCGARPPALLPARALENQGWRRAREVGARGEGSCSGLAVVTGTRHYAPAILARLADHRCELTTCPRQPSPTGGGGHHGGGRSGGPQRRDGADGPHTARRLPSKKGAGETRTYMRDGERHHSREWAINKFQTPSNPPLLTRPESAIPSGFGQQMIHHASGRLGAAAACGPAAEPRHSPRARLPLAASICGSRGPAPPSAALAVAAAAAPPSSAPTAVRFRPCIDIHKGKVKQIVGSTLKDLGGAKGDAELVTNFETERSSAEFARLYQKGASRGRGGGGRGGTGRAGPSLLSSTVFPQRGRCREPGSASSGCALLSPFLSAVHRVEESTGRILLPPFLAAHAAPSLLLQMAYTAAMSSC